jgi:hypothetical protein
MNELFEALYDARRNAISSWQGYHYQGMVALMFFMEVLVRRYDISETEAEKIKLRIEWIEDFVLSENNEAKVICQVKKTLNKSNFEEVLGNFIVQFKILQATRTEWVLVYNNTNLSALNLKQNDYDQYYREHIEEKWLRQINLLIDNCGDNNYWRENLNLNNATSSCKDIRAYLRKWMDNNNLGYDEELEREEVCRLCLEQLCTRLAYTNNDFIEFNNRFRTCQIQMGDIDDICKDRIQELFNANPRRNPMLTTQDILDKLYVDIYHIMIDLESMEEQKNFIYELENVKNVLMDEKNSVACWEAALYREKEKLLEDISNYICNSCNDKGILCNSCILDKVKDWNMRMIVDNVNLEFAPFSVEKADESLQNKISGTKHDLAIDMMERFKTKLKLDTNNVLEMNHQCVVSTLTGGGRVHNAKTLKGIMDNYWEHSKIYRDYKSVLTQDYNYTFSEQDISVLKKAIQEHQEAPAFNEIRETDFRDYRGEVL